MTKVKPCHAQSGAWRADLRGESRGVGLSGSQRALLSKKGFFVYFSEEDSFLRLFNISMFKNV